MFFCLGQGFIMPIFGLLIPKALFAMAIPIEFNPDFRSDVNFWVGLMALAAVGALICTFSGKYFFSEVG